MKNFFVILFLIFFSTSLNAQIRYQYGAKTGINFTTITHSGLDIYSFTTGFIFGPTLELKSPSSYFSVQTELLFFQYGAGIKDTGIKLEFNYIQIPLLLKYRFDSPLADNSPVLFAGPYANLFITSDGRIPGMLGTQILDDFNDSPVGGIMLGAGLSRKVIQLGIQVNIGLVDTFRSAYTTGEKNLGIALTVGAHF